MEERFERETDGLRRSWDRYDGETLRDYLVQDVEDPRINVQSILTRRFLVRGLFGEQFDELIEHEIRFALVMNWVGRLLKESVRPGQLQGVLSALYSGEDEAEGITVPGYVSETFATLALPNYMCDLFNWTPAETTEAPVPEYLFSTFETIWREVLGGERGGDVSVVEPACGSGNDYRFLESFGIGRLIEYMGFDLCEKNVGNAKRMFPGVRFEVGNAFEIDARDEAFDYCFVHDLFEHLSVEGMEVAIGEICRVTRRGMCVGFFNMHDGTEHVVTEVDDYHWNKLSVGRTKAVFEGEGAAVEVVRIDEFLKAGYGCGETHNKDAYTFIVEM